MSPLQISTMGPLQIAVDGEPAVGFDSDKVRGLLVYLAVESDYPHRREKLAGLLWPNYPERSARTSLRRALANLRQVIDDQSAKPAHLLVTRQTIQFNRESDHKIDVVEFTTLLEGAPGKSPDAEQLEKAVTLYHGSFLEGFSIPDSSIFEEWALVTRESLQRKALRALHHLAGYYQEIGDLESALQHAQRQVDLEPYQETAHQQMMWILALNGQRNEAIEQYDQFCMKLDAELGVLPTKETQEMYQGLLEGELPGPPTTTIILRREPKTVGECPYRGLAAFREADAAFFYGRADFSERLLETVRRRSLVAVIVGSSGSGKSSAVFAGLLPQLREEGNWLLVDFRPGSRPFQAIAGALIPYLEPGLSETDILVENKKLADVLLEGEVYLDSVIERALEKSPQATRLLLIVDQFEELYTLCPDPDLRRRFLDVLTQAMKAGTSRRISPFIVLFTLRADFMGQALAHRAFADALQDGSLILGPMNETELRVTIEKPAEKQGAAFETGLVTRILGDVGREPGNLPLLEFALTLLWERLDQGWMTHAAYDEIGRVEGALARYAEEVFTELQEDEREKARRVFVQLVQPGQGTEDTRRVAVRTELEGESWTLIQHLADKRLIVTGRDQGGRETVEIVHEALIRGWERLRGWMEADRGFRTWQEDLRVALRRWETSGKDEGALLRGSPLAQAETWMDERGSDLSQAEKTYIQASVALRDFENSRREQRRRQTIIGLAAGLVIALVLALLAGGQWQRADRASALAVARQQTAQADADARATAQALAEEMTQVAVARELAAAAIANLGTDPELSTLLALQAARQTHAAGQGVLPEAEDALHKAVQAMRVVLTLPDGGGVDYNPDGTRLVIAGPDETASIWDAASGEQLLILEGHSDNVMNVAYSADGKRVATTSQDATAIIWDAGTGEPLLTLVGHEAELVSPAFSPDGSLLATTSFDGTARVWDTRTGEELLTLPHAGVTGGVDFSPDGGRLAVADHDAYQVRIWDVSTGELLLSLEGHTEEVNDVVYSPDGSRLATASSDTTAKVWDAETGQALITLETENGFVFGIDFSPDGDYIATGGVAATATIWDAATGKDLLMLTGHVGGISNVVFSPDGKHLATEAGDETKIWDIRPVGGGEFLTLAGHAVVAFRMDYSPDGNRLATAGFDGLARVWGYPSGEELLQLSGHTDIVYDVKFDPTGSRLATASEDGTAVVWDANSGRALLTIEGNCGYIYSVDFSPDGSRLAIACDDGTARVLDSTTAELSLIVEHPDSKLFRTIFGVAFSSDGRYLATAGWDWTARIWEASTGRELHALEHTDRVNHVVFSSDGKYLATASWDGLAKVWEVATGTLVSDLSGHSGIVWGVAFSPDKATLATGSFDGTTKVWDFASGRELLSLKAVNVAVGGVAFSPDGHHLAAAGGDGAIRIYVLSIDELITLAERRVTRWFTTGECRQYLHLEQCPPPP